MCVCVCLFALHTNTNTELTRVQEVSLLVLFKFPFYSTFHLQMLTAKLPLWIKARGIVKLYRKNKPESVSLGNNQQSAK